MKRTTNNNKSKIKKFFYYLWKTIKFILKTFLFLGVVSSLAIGLYISNVLKDTPQITETLMKESVGGTSNMYAADGSIIWSDTERRRDFIEIENVPQKYKDVLLATEDNEFYENPGFSIKGLANALKTRGGRGGSGINQQLVKNLVFSSNVKDRTIVRKIKELWLAVQMEKNFSKDEILEYYINLMFMGEGSYGANTIAITYYGTSLKDMTGNDPQTLSKLAIIAGLGQAPSTYNLYDNPEAVEKRRNEVLYSAWSREKITEQEYNEAKSVPIQEGLQERYWRNSIVINEGNEHSAYITSALEQVKDLGYDITKTPIQIYTGLNKQINSDVKYIFDSFWGYQDEGMQAAGTFIEPSTGLVLAQYGGRYSQAFGLNRATSNTRSSGSSTKPFISYGPAIQYFGKGSGTILDSSNYVYPGTNFVARNYGGYTYGNVTMTRALKLSLNTPAIRLLDNVVGSDLTKEFLANLNMDMLESYGGQDALGINVSTEQLAGAFATLANMGTYKTPQYVTKLVFNDGSSKEISFSQRRAMNESTAYILLKMLGEVPRPDGTAISAILPYEGYSVKTGTVGYDSSYGFPDNTSSDNWIAGTTKNISGAIWTGYDTPYEWGGQVYDSYYNVPQQLLKQIMIYFNEGKDTSAWPQPATVTGSGVENLSPTDYGRKISQYYVPEVNNVDSSILNKLSQSVSKTLKDSGMDKYQDPSDLDEVMNWKESADQSQLNIYNNYNGDPLRAVVNEEKAYYNIP